MRRPKKTPKLRVTGLCEGNPPVTDGFPSQRASNAENVSIWWRHHELDHCFVSRVQARHCPFLFPSILCCVLKSHMTTAAVIMLLSGRTISLTVVNCDTCELGRCIFTPHTQGNIRCGNFDRLSAIYRPSFNKCNPFWNEKNSRKVHNFWKSNICLWA